MHRPADKFRAMNAERPTKRPKTAINELFCGMIASNESFISLETKRCPPKLDVDSLHQKVRKATTDQPVSNLKSEIDPLTKDACEFLSNLDDRKHDEDSVKGVIEAFPKALVQQDDDYHAVPIQKLMMDCQFGISFVPLLVTEGRRFGLFSTEEKDGLASSGNKDYLDDILFEFLTSSGDRIVLEKLGIDGEQYNQRENDENDLEFHALLKEANDMHDRKTKHILQQLFELNVFEKKDIDEYKMIVKSSNFKHSKERLKFLLNLFPEALSKPYHGGLLPIQEHAEDDDEYGFRSLLQAGLKYYPEKLGFLFARHPSSSEYRTIDLVLPGEWTGFSQKDLFKWIHESIPPSDEYPILHLVIRLAPKYLSLFWKYYPDAIYLRDKEGRLPLHIALQKAGKWSPSLLSMIAVNDPIGRNEKDPVIGLYPFMSAASGRKSDLNVVYYLLRRNPKIWEGLRGS